MNLKGAEKLSVAKAKKLIEDVKGGRFISVLFQKETDGTDRLLQFRATKEFKDPKTGFITVREFPSNEIRSFNIQKVKGIKANKVTYKLPFAKK